MSYGVDVEVLHQPYHYIMIGLMYRSSMYDCVAFFEDLERLEVRFEELD